MNKKETKVIGVAKNGGAVRPYTVIVVGENPQRLDGTSRLLVATSGAQAIEQKDGRALFQVNGAFLEAQGIDLSNISTDLKNPTALDIDATKFFGTEVAIQVTETTTQRVGSKQEPKMNPATAEEMKHKGLPIFRYTDVVPADSVQNTFLTADK